LRCKTLLFRPRRSQPGTRLRVARDPRRELFCELFWRHKKVQSFTIEKRYGFLLILFVVAKSIAKSRVTP
jgi:hypothetical protein